MDVNSYIVNISDNIQYPTNKKINDHYLKKKIQQLKHSPSPEKKTMG